jgi:hypothetical protein
MATITAQITLSSTDLLTDTLSASVSTSITASNTTGMARRPITSTAKGTAAGQVVLYTGGDFSATVYLYVKNTDTDSGDYVYVYVDTAADDPDLLKLNAGEWAFLPLNADETLTAYATSSGTVVEYMVFGTDA